MGRRQILVIEHDDELEEAIVETLASAGRDAVGASPRDPAAAIRDERPELVLLGGRLEHASYTALLQMMGAMSDGPQLLLLTATSRDEEIATSLGVPALRKAFSAEQLHAAVARGGCRPKT